MSRVGWTEQRIDDINEEKIETSVMIIISLLLVYDQLAFITN